MQPSQTVEQDVANVILDHLETGGMSRDLARIACSSMQAVTPGWSLFESNASVHPMMIGNLDSDAAFHLTLTQLAEGLARADLSHPPAATGPVTTSPPTIARNPAENAVSKSSMPTR